MDKTYRIEMPNGFDAIASLAWRLMEHSHCFVEREGMLFVLDESAGFDEPTWEGNSFAELEAWLIHCFQVWIATGPENNPMWEIICSKLR